MSDYIELGSVAEFVSDRIDIERVNKQNYISTENMIEKKGGVINAKSLPTSKTVLNYKPEDILVSNIRLYFEKIWFADKEGGSSADVLVLRTAKGYIPKFIYYVLSDSNFFKYADVTSKGTKMPRGDKKAILKYIIPDYPIYYQKKITTILSTYDNLIENNNRRIQILEQTAEELYKEWFVRMRFPGYEKTKFDKGIPEGWEVRRIKDLGEVITGKTPPTNDEENYGGEVMFVKTPDMNGNLFTIETESYLSNKGNDSQPKKLIPEGSIMVSCIGTGGVVSINGYPAHTNQQINSIILNKSLEREWAYFTLHSMKGTIELFGATGATMTNLSKGKFENLKILYPINDLVLRYHTLTKGIFSKIKNLNIQNQNLKKQRDLLLPRLMNGTITVK
ncbi:restriction endonuclease subunit S [Amphibacillus indicireducens]|uniref:Type I restriction modification DNA specificity domain-containing protein n=1 Tax=Amphibacillus indicireducens TaxID=1076330 RepID=A0ABP7V7X0_9BACI